MPRINLRSANIFGTPLGEGAFLDKLAIQNQLDRAGRAARIVGREAGLDGTFDTLGWDQGYLDYVDKTVGTAEALNTLTQKYSPAWRAMRTISTKVPAFGLSIRYAPIIGNAINLGTLGYYGGKATLEAFNDLANNNGRELAKSYAPLNQYDN